MKKRTCERNIILDPNGTRMYTATELIDHTNMVEAKNEHLECEIRDLEDVSKKICEENAKLKEKNEKLQQDNRRMLILIAVMEKLLGVELTELI